MRTYTLDANNMLSLDAAYEELENVLELPEYFGRNLDALEECLSDLADREGSISIIVEHADMLEDRVSEWKNLSAVLVANPYVSLIEEKDDF